MLVVEAFGPHLPTAEELEVCIFVGKTNSAHFTKPLDVSVASFSGANLVILYKMDPRMDQV